MKISTQLEKLINQQINLEFKAKYSYLAMSAWLETTPYRGFAFWMRSQSDEENEHAMKFFDYLNDRLGRVHLLELPSPRLSFESPLDVFRASFAQEQDVTRSIHHIYQMALEEKDYPTTTFLDWFLTEQVEEEKSVQEIIDQLEFAGSNVDALMRVDNLAWKARREEKH